jgi:hypothetical protein
MSFSDRPSFLKSSPETLGQFQPGLAQISLGCRGFKIVQMIAFKQAQMEIITEV